MAQTTHLCGPLAACPPDWPKQNAYAGERLAVCQPDSPSNTSMRAAGLVPTQWPKQHAYMGRWLCANPMAQAKCYLQNPTSKYTTIKYQNKKTRPLCGSLAACQLDGSNMLLTNSTRWPASCYCMMQGVRILLPLLLGLTALLYMHVKATNDRSRPATIGRVPTQ